MRVAAVRGEELGEIKKVPTPPDAHEGIATFVGLAKELADGEAIGSIAGCVPGRVDADGAIYDARNIPQWNGTNIVEELGSALGAPVRAVNDAILVGLGEVEKGAGKGFPVVAYITVSTGVGGARVARAAGDLAGSPLLGDVELKVGDLEGQISGTAVRKKFGIHPKELDSLEERNKLADILANGLAELTAVWKPDVFVLGGSMIVGVNPIPLERLREKFSVVPVKMAKLGDSGGLIGGAILAMQK